MRVNFIHPLEYTNDGNQYLVNTYYLSQLDRELLRGCIYAAGQCMK